MSWTKISFNLFVTLTFLPVFVYFNGSGVSFDALGGWDAKLSQSILPPLPISQLLVVFLSLLFMKELFLNKFIYIVLFVILINFFVLLLINSMVYPRFITFAIELLNLVIAFIVFNIANKRYWCKLSFSYKYHSLASLAILIGLTSLFSSFVLNLEPTNFVSKSIVIYNFYDYFSVLFGAVFIFTLIYRRSSKIAIVFYFILFLFFYHFSNITGSRAVFYSVLLALSSIGVLQIIKYIFKKEVPYTFVFYFMVFISLIYLIGSYNNSFDYLDQSVGERSRMIIKFFDSISFFSLFFPATNPIKASIFLDGSLHNESLEIFSNFGILGLALVYTFLYKITLNRYKNYQSTILIIFIFLMGLLQLNLFHPFSSNLLMLLLSIHINNDLNLSSQ